MPGYDEGALDQCTGSTLERREDDFLLFLLPWENSSSTAWKEAITAVQVVNSLPDSSRGDRRVRLVVPSESPVRKLAGDVRYLGQVSRFSHQPAKSMHALMACDAVIALEPVTPGRSAADVIAAMCKKIPVIAADHELTRELVTYQGRDAGILLPLNAKAAS